MTYYVIVNYLLCDVKKSTLLQRLGLGTDGENVLQRWWQSRSVRNTWNRKKTFYIPTMLAKELQNGFWSPVSLLLGLICEQQRQLLKENTAQLWCDIIMCRHFSAHSYLHEAPMCCESLCPLVYIAKLYMKRRETRLNCSDNMLHVNISIYVIFNWIK